MKIGIIGAGQLGRMLALSGYPLGLRFVFLDKSADAPGGQVGSIITGAFDDVERLHELAGAVDLITFDVENVSVDAIRAAIGARPFRPPLHALEIAQDRLKEKALFRELGMATAEFVAVDDRNDLSDGTAALGVPAVLKTRRFGYDGKGQRVIRAGEQIDTAWAELGDRPLILERWVAFEREISLIGVRSISGETVFYPISLNVHEEGILRYSIAPYEQPELQREAEQHMLNLMRHLDYAGVLTIEFFVVDGRLVANEIAPRVHNSGHWTIEGAVTSQFENHIRAILGLPLGHATALGHSAMVNFLGELPELVDVLAVPGVHFHSYGKSPRPQRKLGHCTINTPSRELRDEGLQRLLALTVTARSARR